MSESCVLTLIVMLIVVKGQDQHVNSPPWEDVLQLPSPDDCQPHHFYPDPAIFNFPDPAPMGHAHPFAQDTPNQTLSGLPRGGAHAGNMFGSEHVDEADELLQL